MYRYLFDCEEFLSGREGTQRAKTKDWAAFVDKMKDTRLTLHRDGRKFNAPHTT